MRARSYAKRLPLLGVLAALGGALTLGVVGRAGHAFPSAPELGTPLLARDLTFADRADGAVIAREAPSGRVIEVFEGEQGFLRGTLRSFARTRRLAHLGPEAPFHLARWPDGRLTLDDQATGQHAELLAFGASNWPVFDHLLEAAR